MDILTGLSAASQAIGIAKELKEIDRSVDEAGFKLKLAELTEALADTKIALADAKALVADLEGRISELSEGAICPVCQTGRLSVHSVERNKLKRGLEYHHSSCSASNCTYTNVRNFDTSTGKYIETQ